jgi:hypothetical protein
MNSRIRIYVIVIALVLSSILLTSCDDPIQFSKKDLCNYTPAAENFDPNAKISGKIAVVYLSGSFNPKTNNGCTMDGYDGPYRVSRRYFPDEMYARSADEIDTLIIAKVKKGDFIQTVDFKRTQSLGWMTDVYTGLFSISVINYKTGTLVQNSVRPFSKVPEKIDQDDLILPETGKSINAQYLVEPTTEEVRTMLRKFSDNVRTDQ